MSRGRWHAPLDPDCPDVISYSEQADDPFMQMSGCWGEFWQDFEKRHRAKCERCQQYGVENIDIAY